MCRSQPNQMMTVKRLDGQRRAAGRGGMPPCRDPQPGPTAGRVAWCPGEKVRDLPVLPGSWHRPEPPGPGAGPASRKGRAVYPSLRLFLGFARQTLIDPLLPSQIKIACLALPLPEKPPVRCPVATSSYQSACHARVILNNSNPFDSKSPPMPQRTRTMWIVQLLFKATPIPPADRRARAVGPESGVSSISG